MGIKCPKCQTDNPDTQKFCGECATPFPSSKKIPITETLETPAEELTRGTTLASRYEIIEELGKGGMGRVYKVHDTEIKEKVALKLLKPEIAADKKSIERFRNELKIARKVSHKRVCRMYDIGKEEEKYFITMEYVEGEDLKSLVREKGKISEDEVLRLAKQICEGLAEAHEQGIVHRDLKPQNIMIDKEKNAKIMDFGIARSVEAPGITHTGMIIGTPNYISPEQVEGKEADQRSDIYALGVILYEMATGNVPFKGDSALNVALKHKAQLPQDPRSLNPDVSKELSRLILICIEKNREKRYQSAEALLCDLKNIEQDFPLGMKIQFRRKSFALTWTRRLIIPALIILVAISAIVIWNLTLKRSSIEHSLAVISFDNQTGDANYDYLQEVIPNLLITSLEQSKYFSVITWERMYDLLKQFGKGDVEIIDKELGFELCRLEGVEAIVLGSFSKADDIFVTDAKVLDVNSKELLKSASSKGTTAGSILEKQIDELSKEISKGVGLSEKKVKKGMLKITEVTTKSMDAYKFYLKGRELQEKFYFSDAQYFLERALEFDPTFSSAYYHLSIIYQNLGDTEAANEAIKKAMTFSDKATEKQGLYIAHAYAVAIEGNQEKSFQILEKIKARFPKDKGVYFFLALKYRHFGLYDRAIEAFQKVLELDPEYRSALNWIAFTYINIEDYDKALEYLERYIALYPEEANPYDLRGDVYFRIGRLDKAIADYKKALDLKPDFLATDWKIGYLYGLKEDYEEALKWNERFISLAPSERYKSEGYLWKGFFHYWIGKYKEVSENVDKAIDIAEKAGIEASIVQAYWLKGFISMDRGKFELSRESFKKYLELIWEVDQPLEEKHKIRCNLYLGLLDLKQKRYGSLKTKLNEIEQTSSKPSLSLEKYFYNLMLSELYLSENSPEKAIEVCEKASFPELPVIWMASILKYNVPLPDDVFARAYYLKGDVERAIAEYERLITIIPDNMNRRLIHPKRHYQLGILYEEIGQNMKAIRCYEKFLSLWKDADPGIAEVEDAKKKLAGLKSK